eukprot:jgi/Botrbrau1/15625/Bobra.4_1s0012.1
MGACTRKCGTCSGANKSDGYAVVNQAPKGPRVLYTNPVVGVTIKAPKVPPSPGDILLGYELKPVKLGYNRSFTTTGWVATGVLLAFAWPFFWIPAVMRSLHDVYQRPVYGQPGQATYQIVSGYPVQPGPNVQLWSPGAPQTEYDKPLGVSSPTTPNCAPPKI